MAFALRYDPNNPKFVASFIKAQGNVADALTGAVRDAAKLAVASGRSNLGSAGFHGKFQNGLRYALTPSTGSSLEPSARIYHRFGFMSVFEHGATITGSPYLWIPLDSVPVIKGRRLTPKQFAGRFGQLVTIRRAGKPPMLGARVPVSRTGKIANLTKASLKPSRRPGKAERVQVVPMYIGVPKVSIAKRLDIEGVTRRSAEFVGSLYHQKLKVD